MLLQDIMKCMQYSNEAKKLAESFCALNNIGISMKEAIEAIEQSIKATRIEIAEKCKQSNIERGLITLPKKEESCAGAVTGNEKGF